MRFINTLIGLGMVADLWLHFTWWLFWVLVGNLVLQLAILVAIRRRNAAYMHAAYLYKGGKEAVERHNDLMMMENVTKQPKKE